MEWLSGNRPGDGWSCCRGLCGVRRGEAYGTWAASSSNKRAVWENRMSSGRPVEARSVMRSNKPPGERAEARGCGSFQSRAKLAERLRFLVAGHTGHDMPGQAADHLVLFGGEVELADHTAYFPGKFLAALIRSNSSTPSLLK
jgi:hypothetical protein